MHCLSNVGITLSYKSATYTLVRTAYISQTHCQPVLQNLRYCSSTLCCHPLSACSNGQSASWSSCQIYQCCKFYIETILMFKTNTMLLLNISTVKEFVSSHKKRRTHRYSCLDLLVISKELSDSSRDRITLFVIQSGEDSARVLLYCDDSLKVVGKQDLTSQVL